MTLFALRILAAVISFVPGAAIAHTGHGEASGFVHGLAHPIFGLDHILAMVTVGIFARQLGGRAVWLVPTTFVTIMTAGGALGLAEIPMPFVEIAIALSIVVLGAVIALSVKAPIAAAMGMVGLFAIFHGHAHGTEMPAGLSGLAYAFGFLSATTALHISGIALGILFNQLGEASRPNGYRLSGACSSFFGLMILIRAV